MVGEFLTTEHAITCRLNSLVGCTCAPLDPVHECNLPRSLEQITVTLGDAGAFAQTRGLTAATLLGLRRTLNKACRMLGLGELALVAIEFIAYVGAYWPQNPMAIHAS